MSDDPGRPSPDALLEEARREARGRVKVFLGAAPGVGKTFAMLRAGRERLADGVDVVVAIVETHGRAETEAMAAGLPTIPRIRVEHRGRTFEEMDLDAVLARRPRLALVDELAHTNVPGSRNAKRWQDVEEMLAAGIDVLTTVNVQHLESLNDLVERITGVRVRETLPDRVLQGADEIELIDLAPAELLKRLAEGKVYRSQQAGRAVENFFRPGNLTALREMALRQTADRVDRQMVSWMRSHAVAGPWPTRERILVLIGSEEGADRLVRAAKRAADRRDAPWLAVHVETPRSAGLPEAVRERIDAAMRLALELGGETAVLHGEDLTAEVLAKAREANASVIIAGRSRSRGGWRGRFARSLVDDLIARAEGFDVLVVGSDDRHPPTDRADAVHRRLDRPTWAAFAEAVVATVVATGVSAVLWRLLDVPNLALIYLVAVLTVSSRHGLWPSISAAILGFLAYNFFFTQPYYSFRVEREQDLISLLFFVLVSVVVSNLAARLKSQVEATRKSVRRTTNLYEFSRKVAGAAILDDVLWAVVHHVASTLQGRSLVLMPRDDALRVVAGYPPEDVLDPASQAAADWAWRKAVPAGWATATLPMSPWLFLPLKTSQGLRGVLGVQLEDKDGVLSPDQLRLLDALADQAAIAIERAQLVVDLEQARVTAETERLRAALLSSISHDLRTPLVSILGSATSLIDYERTLGPAQRLDLARTIQEEAERLNRFVQNLLDMTRIGAGALKPRRDWIDLRDVMAAAVAQARPLLRDRPVRLDLPDDLPLVHLDPALMQQVLFNLIDNAGKHAHGETPIGIRARVEGASLRLEVTDEGPGIPPEDREKVFDMFYRVREGDTRTAGTGLGLAICRGIVAAHGGTIAVEDGANGSGTRIVIRVPTGGPAPSGAGE